MNTEGPHPKSSNPTIERAVRSAVVPLLIVGLVILLWAVSWILISRYIVEEKRGAFGDMFGAVNALFSGLAFGGVVYAIMLQRQELELQREELRLSREEFSNQTRIMADQLAAMRASTEFERQKEALLNEPFFVFHDASSNPGRYRMRFINHGADVREVKIEILEGPTGSSMEVEPSEVIASKEKCEIRLTDPAGREGGHGEIRLRMNYRDRLGVLRSKKYILPAGVYALREIME